MVCISKEQLLKRKEFVDTYLERSPAWWQGRMHMVLDDVTLTMAPRPLNSKQEHAAQRLRPAAGIVSAARVSEPFCSL